MTESTRLPRLSRRAAATPPRGGLLARGVAAALIAGASLVPPAVAAAADDEPGPPELELQASATGYATNDQMVVHLNAEQSGTEVGPLNDKVLEALRKALDSTRGVAGVPTCALAALPPTGSSVAAVAATMIRYMKIS